MSKAPGKTPTGGKGSGAKYTGSKGARPKQSTIGSAGSNPSKAVVPRAAQNVIPASLQRGFPMTKQKDGTLVPHGYTARPVRPAKNYDVVSFARALNDDFAPRLKKLFDPETEAAVDAQKTGIYIGWRLPGQKFDCQRVSKMSKCFCGHLLGEHDRYTGHSVQVRCIQSGCPCKAYAWIPSRVEDIGEFWHQRRRDFDPSTWRAKCRCRHTHEEHNPNGMHRCKARGCGCAMFDSNFLCAACDKHWEDHQTFFDTEDMRIKEGLPYGAKYLPFAEMPDLRNIALTGQESDDSAYLALTQGEGSIPTSQRPQGNNAVVSFHGQPQGGSSRTPFRPVYD
ncbi:protein FAM221B-like [Liolophura sinensis]|uniref:protein FAM221B-like n=1 Tax=Liolophura sinensis TaxID=3198878 RepID=UPI00315811F7